MSRGASLLLKRFQWLQKFARNSCQLRSRWNIASVTSRANKYGIDIKAIAKAVGEKPKGNYHLDHIYPVDAFDLTKSEHIRLCWSPQNLRWLSAKENLKKKAEYDPTAFKAFLTEALSKS